MDDRLDTAPCGYLVLGPDRLIEYANATLAEWLGYPRDSLEGAPLSEILPPASQIAFDATVAPLLELQGSAMGLRTTLLTIDGRSLPALYNAVRQRHGEARVTAFALFLLEA